MESFKVRDREYDKEWRWVSNKEWMKGRKWRKKLKKEEE